MGAENAEPRQEEVKKTKPGEQMEAEAKGPDKKENDKKEPEPTQEELDQAEINGTTEAITDKIRELVDKNPDLATPDKLGKLAKLVTDKTIEAAKQAGFDLTEEQIKTIGGEVQKFITNVIREQGLTEKEKNQVTKVYSTIIEKTVQLVKSNPEEAAKRGGRNVILKNITQITLSNLGDNLNAQQIAAIQGKIDDLIKSTENKKIAKAETQKTTQTEKKQNTKPTEITKTVKKTPLGDITTTVTREGNRTTTIIDEPGETSTIIETEDENGETTRITETRSKVFNTVNRRKEVLKKSRISKSQKD